MTDPPVAPPPAADATALAEPHAIPRRTTPTWDMELLISGASVFALFQLSGEIDLLVAWFEPRLGVEWAAFLSMMNVYGKGAVITLAVTFAVHLLLRARWIALVGMNSVFPGGIRWDRIKAGPIQVEVAKARVANMDDVIERADNLSTVVFAIGVALAIGIIPPALTVIVLYAVGVAVGSAFGTLAFFYIFLGLLAVVLLPFFIAAGIDKYRGDQLDRSSGLGRWIERTMRAYSWIGFGRSGNVLITLLGSNVGEKRATVLVWLAMFAVMALATVGPLMRAADVRLADWDWVPEDRAGDARDLRAVHYADLRQPGLSGLNAPYLPSSVVRGPWLRLVIPYDAVRHNEAIGRDCPDAAADDDAKAEAEFARRARLLDCIARMHPLRLDGAPLADIEFSFHTAADGMRGFAVMIDVRGLAPGRHVLEVGRPTVERDARRDEPPQPYRIAFWR
ncbi:MAG: hypothetical protein ACK59M_06775 [Pseudomonadota bacterium]|jgi:hypothetical protein